MNPSSATRALPPASFPADDDAARCERLGIARGRWVLRPNPVSAMAQLTYARELHALEQRWAIVCSDRLLWPLPRRHPGQPEPEPDALHVHDDAELRVVLAGQARYVVVDGDTPLLLDVGPGDWIRLPAGLPHRLLPRPGDRLDLLRLFSRPDGARARLVDPALELPR